MDYSRSIQTRKTWNLFSTDQRGLIVIIYGGLSIENYQFPRVGTVNELAQSLSGLELTRNIK